MEIQHIIMTGSDLKKVYDISELNGHEFAKRLGIARPTLYTYFKDEVVDPDIEKKVMDDPLLSDKYRQLFKPAVQEPKVSAEALYGSIDKLISMLTNQLDEQKQNAASLRRSNDNLIANNDDIRKDASVFRDIVQMVMKVGGLKIDKAALSRMR